jgi:hypothetical protein
MLASKNFLDNDVCMNGSLQNDLRKIRGMAFRHHERCGRLLHDFHNCRTLLKSHPQGQLLAKVYSWLLVPFSLWPIDFCGLSKHLLSAVKTDNRFDQELVLLLETIDEPPDEYTRTVVGAFEADVEAGRYEQLIKQPEKFNELDTKLLQDKSLASAWNALKQFHNHKQYQNSKGVIRRRLSQERNLREGWEFDWTDARKRFYSIFDAVCHRWRLYGVEHDKPLLLKISVNPTPHGTMILIPRDWSLDPVRDLNWKAINKIHRAHGAKRQGPKLSPGRIDQLKEAATAKRLWSEAGSKGFHGDARVDYVRQRMNRANRKDSSWLKRLLRIASRTATR